MKNGGVTVFDWGSLVLLVEELELAEALELTEELELLEELGLVEELGLAEEPELLEELILAEELELSEGTPSELFAELHPVNISIAPTRTADKNFFIMTYPFLITKRRALFAGIIDKLCLRYFYIAFLKSVIAKPKHKADPYNKACRENYRRQPQRSAEARGLKLVAAYHYHKKPERKSEIHNIQPSDGYHRR